MQKIRQNFIYAIVAAVIAILAYFWWSSLQGIPGDIAMGEDDRLTEIVSIVVAGLGTATAIINLAIAVVKFKSEKKK